MVTQNLSKRNPVAQSVATAVILVIAFAAFMLFATSGTISRVNEVEEADVPLLQAAWEIRYLDEVLTQSAARYVNATPENRDQWQNRYDQAATDLDETFAFALSEATPEETAFIDDVSEANDRLIELEGQMFELTNSGDPAAAVAILEGEYQDLKVDYAVGLDGFFAAQQDRTRTSIESAGRAANTARVVVVLLVIAMVALLIRIQSIVSKLMRGETSGSSRGGAKDGHLVGSGSSV